PARAAHVRGDRGPGRDLHRHPGGRAPRPRRRLRRGRARRPVAAPGERGRRERLPPPADHPAGVPHAGQGEPALRALDALFPREPAALPDRTPKIGTDPIFLITEPWRRSARQHPSWLCHRRAAKRPRGGRARPNEKKRVCPYFSYGVPMKSRLPISTPFARRMLYAVVTWK